MSPEDVCFVALNYRRPWNIPSIVNAAAEYGFGDIVIWDNADNMVELQNHLLQGSPQGVSVYRTGVTEDGNQFTMGRYAAAMEMSRKRFVATCDDDYVLTRAGWDQLFEHWDGTSIVAQLPDSNNQFGAAQRLPFVNLGYGSLFEASWAKTAFMAIDEVTEQQERKILVRKADRCFTTYHRERIILKAEFGKHLIRLRNPDGSYSETDSNSIHLSPDHIQDTHRAVSFALQARQSAQLQR